MKTNLVLFKKTPRLILRPLELRDYENWRQAYSLLRPAQNEWDEGPWADKELTLAKFKSLLLTQKKSSFADHAYHLGVFRKDDGVLVGQVSLMDISREIFQNAYLGYRIFNIYWGQGFATEAATGAMDLAFKKLKLHRVEAGIAPSNKRSIKVAKALGLRKEGLSSKRLKVNGRWQDMVIYAATVEDLR